MPRARRYLTDFALDNPLYTSATVQVFSVNPTTLAVTGTLAPLYSDPLVGPQIANPQTLDSAGKWMQPVYVDQPVVMTISGLGFATHTTGIISARGRWAGDWAPSTAYFQDDQIRDGAAGSNTLNVYTCAAPHTSGNTFATDLGAGKWSTYIDIIAATSNAAGLWVPYTPVVSAETGTFSSVITSGRYKKIGRTVAVQAGVDIVNAGSATGRISLSLPAGLSTDVFFLCGREVSVTGVSLIGTISVNQSVVNVVRFDGSTIIATGHVAFVGGIYESNV